MCALSHGSTRACINRCQVGASELGPGVVATVPVPKPVAPSDAGVSRETEKKRKADLRRRRAAAAPDAATKSKSAAAAKAKVFKKSEGPMLGVGGVLFIMVAVVAVLVWLAQ